MEEEAQTVLSRPSVRFYDHYIEGTVLGQGSDGTVRKCIEVESMRYYACKSILKSHLDIEAMRSEVKVLFHLVGEMNIVQVKEVLEDDHQVYIVMDYCSGGTLKDWVEKKIDFSEKEAAQIMAIIIRVIHKCHSLGIVHRDVKLTNFVFRRQDDINSLTAVDFGLSIFFTPGEPLTGLCGTELFVAPEILDGGDYGPEVDIWSAGVLLFKLLSIGRGPGRCSYYTSEEIDYEKQPWLTISDNAKDLVRKMLCVPPSLRLTTQQVIDHPWIRENVDATHRELSSGVVPRLRRYSAMNKYEKMGLWVIAWGLSKEETGGFRYMFRTMDSENCGKISLETLRNGLKRYDSTLEDSDFVDIGAGIGGLIDCKEWIVATIPDGKMKFTPSFLEEAFLRSKPPDDSGMEDREDREDDDDDELNELHDAPVSCDDLDPQKLIVDKIEHKFSRMTTELRIYFVAIFVAMFYIYIKYCYS